jgi:hypothetical protein
MTTTKATESHESNPLSVLGEALDAASASINEARADATASAKSAALKVQSGVGTGAYYAAYGVSYSLVFSGVFLKELLPIHNSIRRGFEDGAGAAIDTVARLQAREDSEVEALEDGAHAEPVKKARKSEAKHSSSSSAS